MAITKNNTIGSLTIYRNGLIGVQMVVEILEDDIAIMEKFKCKVLEPGSDVSAEPKKIRDICALIWTQAVIDAWIASKQNQIT